MFRRWRNRKTYEWHLEKIERLHNVPRVDARTTHLLINSHAAVLRSLSMPTKTDGGQTQKSVE